MHLVYNEAQYTLGEHRPCEHRPCCRHQINKFYQTIQHFCLLCVNFTIFVYMTLQCMHNIHILDIGSWLNLCPLITIFFTKHWSLTLAIYRLQLLQLSQHSLLLITKLKMNVQIQVDKVSVRSLYIVFIMVVVSVICTSRQG